MASDGQEKNGATGHIICFCLVQIVENRFQYSISGVKEWLYLFLNYFQMFSKSARFIKAHSNPQDMRK
jgi:hypothetical protein